MHLVAAVLQIENIASLKLLMAMEEETKRKAALVKKQYQGPSVKFHSLKANDAEHVSVSKDNGRHCHAGICVLGPLRCSRALVLQAGSLSMHPCCCCHRRR